MLRSLSGPFTSHEDIRDDYEQQSGNASAQYEEQQAYGLQQLETQTNRLFEDAASLPLRAVWDVQRSETTTGSASTKINQTSERDPLHGFTTYDQAPSSKVKSSKKGRAGNAIALHTVSDAVEYCRGLIEAQLESAEYSRARINSAIHRDAHTRTALATLLPNKFMRVLFIETAKKQNGLSRLRTLFGAPPYNFLHSGDSGFIRAAGIAPGRSNMTYTTGNEIATYAQFGIPHVLDTYGREYRVVNERDSLQTDVVYYDLTRLSVNDSVCFNVRVPKRSRQERLALLKDVSMRRALVFPTVGETLKVKYSDRLLSVWSTDYDTQTETTFIVQNIAHRTATGSTAAVLARLVSL